MEFIKGIENLDRQFRNVVATIGNFDGVHLAHQALFKEVIKRAKKRGGESVAVTFHPHPIRVLRGIREPFFITLIDRKVGLIEECGIDVLISINFTREFAEISADMFVRDILCKRIGVKEIVVGHDYAFGKGREGNIDFLRKKGLELGFEVHKMDAVVVNGMVVSSTLVRKLLRDGDMEAAALLLGRYYRIQGMVMHGRDRGAKVLGFPTANLQLNDEIFPKLGVYVVRVKFNGDILMGVANIGYNPTFGDNALSVEAHIFDFKGDLYNKMIHVDILHRLRDEQKFSGPDALVAQINKDIRAAKKYIASKNL